MSSRISRVLTIGVAVVGLVVATGASATGQEEVTGPPKFAGTEGLKQVSKLEMPEKLIRARAAQAKADPQFLFMSAYSGYPDDPLKEGSRLYVLDLNSGSLFLVGEIRFGRVAGLAFDKAGRLMALGLDRDFNDVLLQLDPNNGNVLSVMQLNPNMDFNALVAVGNRLYTHEDDDWELWKINRNRGNVRQIGAGYGDSACGGGMIKRGRFFRFFANCENFDPHISEIRVDKDNGVFVREARLDTSDVWDPIGHDNENYASPVGAERCGRTTFFAIGGTYSNTPTYLAWQDGRVVRLIHPLFEHVEGMACW